MLVSWRLICHLSHDGGSKQCCEQHKAMGEGRINVRTPASSTTGHDSLNDIVFLQYLIDSQDIKRSLYLTVSHGHHHGPYASARTAEEKGN